MPASALKEPEEYGNNQCELIAKDYQAVYGGSLIWIQSLKPSGAYETGDYSAHVINKVYDKEHGVYYIDYKAKTIMYNLNTVSNWYYESTKKQSQIWDLSTSRPGFNLIWHY